MKLTREALAHFLDSSWKKDPTKAEWEIVGEDIEDMSVDLNPDVSSKKTILGKTKTSDKDTSRQSARIRITQIHL